MHAKTSRFAAVIADELKKRFKDDDCMFMMVLNFVNPKVAHRLPAWLYDHSSSQRRTYVKHKVHGTIENIYNGLVDCKNSDDTSAAVTRQ